MTAAEKLSKDYGAFTCLALIKPRSPLARSLKLEKPAYGILEYSPAFAEVQLRWGDGSAVNLVAAAELNDVILLREYGEQAVSELFD